MSRFSVHNTMIIQKHAPILERRVSERYCNWLSSDLKHVFRSRDKLKMAAVNKKSEVLMVAYKQLRNKLNSPEPGSPQEW